MSIHRYTAFLIWRPNLPHYRDHYAHELTSLASMVEDGYHFDEDLLDKVSKFICKLNENFRHGDFADHFLVILRYGSNFAVEFVDSATILLSSSHRSIVRDTLSYVHECLRSCSYYSRLAIVSSKLFPRILSTPHLRDLSVVEDQGILHNLIEILLVGIMPFRDLVFTEVLSPIEPSLVQISRNPRIVSWNDACHAALKLLFRIVDESVNHQPALDFICSSPIPMAFQTLLSKVENESTHPEFLYSMLQTIYTWQSKGAKSWCRGRILLQTLEREGFKDHLEQTLLHNNLTSQGQMVRTRTCRIMRKWGTHCYLPS
ncbi:hypothetical protein BLNAU_15855 [Blattamonas nauphoetae]|uniref:Uncharacterized protein n=1 Tax=Blattamonas nauphoetae TaxID=2049346 RepID=A0ABQ9X9M6_9EUKA|nr:hypothetical protein BLNAU_15855 [Blattamonas nauphoetae]